MKIVKARVLGFCMGVRRAIDMAVEEARNANGKPVYTLGPLIHNPKVLNDLNALGIKAINSEQLRTAGSTINNEDCINHSIIIRAHGISPEMEKNLLESGCNLIDATCPKVKANQLKIQELSKAGFFLFLAGEENHAEIQGLLGYAEQRAMSNEQRAMSNEKKYLVVSNINDAQKEAEKLFKINKTARTALLGQTTISKDEYFNIANEIKVFFPDLEIINTICAATGERQQALREMLPLVEAVIVAGGEESANTRSLFAIAKESGKPTVLVESAGGIPEEFFKFETVGLCAGASTPDSVIEEIEKALTDGFKN